MNFFFSFFFKYCRKIFNFFSKNAYMSSNVNCFFDSNLISWFYVWYLKKNLSFFFLETNVFNSRIYAIRVFAINSRYFAYQNFWKIYEFFFNFNFVFLLTLASDYRIELIAFYIFNQNYDFTYRDRFSILFIIYY